MRCFVSRLTSRLAGKGQLYDAAHSGVYKWRHGSSGFHWREYDIQAVAENNSIQGRYFIKSSHLLGDCLSCFIMLASTGGIIGNISQSNYAAGNAFQDALAHYRNSKGQSSRVKFTLVSPPGKEISHPRATILNCWLGTSELPCRLSASAQVNIAQNGLQCNNPYALLSS